MPIIGPRRLSARAHDCWTAYREGAFGEQPRPFVGWLMLLEDAPQSRAPVRDTSPHFPVFRDFSGASYAERYNILCHKLMQERLYTGRRSLFRRVRLSRPACMRS